jgi:hypothetical protein
MSHENFEGVCYKIQRKSMLRNQFILIFFFYTDYEKKKKKKVNTLIKTNTPCGRLT